MDVANPAGLCYAFEDKANGICNKAANRPNVFQTTGALIGGPKTPTDAGDPNRIPYSEEGWNDWRTDWVGSEQTLDYNAHFSMALASAIELPASFWTEKCGGMLLIGGKGITCSSSMMDTDCKALQADCQCACKGPCNGIIACQPGQLCFVHQASLSFAICRYQHRLDVDLEGRFGPNS